ncbi:glycosyltransferase [Rhizobium sp. DKSPLA3]|uniref:Glycosyltransferase n=1 Tax=Rhizobium quercicola TaxID=2901226 RepID=A0A9X1NTF5_9HYPH|nr:glycosyltransferase [Rhizobium quercicola]MCD7109681.1 glycosyltransferase [Rhizobium quercicola]
MISIVIPAYNHQNYIGDAIRSCLTDPLITEVLVADDGSSDRTREIIESYASAFPEKIRNLTDNPPKNIGAHHRINQLCRASRNEWIAILNSDDSFSPGRFRNFAQFAKATNADVVFGNCAIVDSDDRELGKKSAFYDVEYSLPIGWTPEKVAANNEYFLALLNQNFIATTSNLVIKKVFFEKLDGFRAYRYIHDWDFIIRATLNGRVVYSPTMWCNYRIHSGNTISESTHRVKDEARRMFASIIETNEFLTYVQRHRCASEVNVALSGNRYLSNDARIALVISDYPKSTEIDRFLTLFPGSKMVSSLAEIDESIDFIYSPTSSVSIVGNNELRNLFLASAMGGYDFFMLASNLNHTTFSTPNMRDISFIKRASAARILSGDYSSPMLGRIMRLPRQPTGDSVSLSSVFRTAVISQSGQDVIVSRDPDARMDMTHRTFDYGQRVSPSRLAGLNEDDTRPVVFVLPSVLAVGGAENVLIEIMRQTKDQFAYVVVCTEVILESQGSWLSRVLEQCESVFDLAESCHETSRLSALAWLKALYQPKALLITNGSMWQMKHAARIRRLFKDCAIIDHQCYDDKFGWIEWFDHPGVLASDLFIAVNSRIEDAFTSRLNVPSEKIRLIYHPIDSARIEKNLPHISRERSLERFGLDSDRPVVAYVGRLADQKRPQIFVDVATIAQQNGSNIQFVMVGQGHLSELIDEQITRNQLANIKRIENIPLLEEFYIAVDVLVITSEYEGVPLAMLEAMSVGVSVVSTDVGDIGRVIYDYQGSEALPVDAAAHEIYERVAAVIDNIDEDRLNANEAAARVREDFSGEFIGRKYQAAISSAIEIYANTRAF